MTTQLVFIAQKFITDLLVDATCQYSFGIAVGR